MTFQRNIVNTTPYGQGTTQKTTQETTQKSGQKTAEIIMEAIRKDPSVNRIKLAELCGISPDGVKWQLKKLQERGVLRRVGPDKGGHWEIVEDNFHQ